MSENRVTNLSVLSTEHKYVISLQSPRRLIHWSTIYCLIVLKAGSPKSMWQLGNEFLQGSRENFVPCLSLSFRCLPAILGFQLPNWDLWLLGHVAFSLCVSSLHMVVFTPWCMSLHLWFFCFLFFFLRTPVIWIRCPLDSSMTSS